MSSMVEIRLTKTTIYLTEQELTHSLPPELFEEGIRRGKAFKRSRDRAARMKHKRETDPLLNKRQ